jgi:hypothetical protein
LLSIDIRKRFRKNARGARAIVQSGQIATTAAAIKNGKMVLNFCFIESAGWVSKTAKNNSCTRATVIRIQVAKVSKAAMTAIRQYFDFFLKSIDMNNQKDSTTHKITTSLFQAKPLA